MNSSLPKSPPAQMKGNPPFRRYIRQKGPLSQKIGRQFLGPGKPFKWCSGGGEAGKETDIRSCADARELRLVTMTSRGKFVQPNLKNRRTAFHKAVRRFFGSLHEIHCRCLAGTLFRKTGNGVFKCVPPECSAAGDCLRVFET